MTEPGTQEIEQARGRLRVRAATTLEQSRVADDERQQHPGAQPERDDGHIEPATTEAFPEQRTQLRCVPCHAREREDDAGRRLPAMQEVDAQPADAGGTDAQEGFQPCKPALERRLDREPKTKSEADEEERAREGFAPTARSRAAGAKPTAP